MELLSVRASVQALLREMKISQLTIAEALPHIASIPDPSTLETNPALSRIVEKVLELCGGKGSSSSRTLATGVVTDHWLLSVPACLRDQEREVVNYLGMVVAIDFRHWAEEAGGGSDPQRPDITGFYTVAATTAATSPVTAEEATALHAETVPGGADSDGGAAPLLLRGSAAMMYLLRKVVEQAGMHWYDPEFLSQFHGDVAAAREAMKACFLGCREDGHTAMWMPATDERVALLLSLSAALSARHTSFYEMLCGSEGRLFGPEGFAQRLVNLHERYHDWVPHPLHPQQTMPILKLSQLTALALQNALPALWVRQREQTEGRRQTGGGGDARPGWLVERAAAAVAAAGSPSLHSSRGAEPLDGGRSVFSDAEELSICCDYQIPKALRDDGLVVYDEHLSRLVDGGVVLGVLSVEEISLRVATLCAVEGLLAYLNHHLGERLNGVRVPVPALDYVLWYIGRYPAPGQAAASRHHLCRTIMY